MLPKPPSSSVPAPTASALLVGEERPELLRQETLADLFEATARRQGRRTALIDGTQRISYAVLDAAADRVAHHLLTTGLAGPGRIIGLWLPRGAGLFIAQLGIAKSGAAWLALDAATPPERVAVCLADAVATAVFCESDRAALLATTGVPTLTMPDLLAEPPAGTVLRRRDGLGRHDPAYVIYTSGSTGRPKGIVISHGAICHFLRSENALLGVSGEDVVYQGFSPAFDMSLEEVWIAYLAGAGLWLAPTATVSDPDALLAALDANHITVLHAVPSLVALLPRLPDHVRLVNLGGEACPQALADRLADGRRRVVNTYGPTETTVSASLAELHAGRPVTIGRPLPNYGLAILDAALQPVPPGQPGELCITGPGLALGYLGRPDLTAERFPSGPFPGLPGVDRLYRTGDQAALDADGNVRFLGRCDDQVKVRGFRVEPGDIEAALAACPGVQAAAVAATGEDLVAAVVPVAARADLPVAPLSVAGLRAALAARLPPYMVPGRIAVVADLPRLPSGKVDRKALATLTVTASPDSPGDTPRNPAETALAAALAALFPGRPFRRSDDFFTDLGGHSLLAARLVSRLRVDHGLPRAAVGIIYAQRTCGAIAARLAEAAPATTPAPLRRDDPGLRRRRWWCGAAQLALLPLPLGVHLVTWLAPFFTYHFLTGDEDQSVLVAVAWTTVVFLLALPTALAVTVVAKRLILPRLAPGRYPLWGWIYLRWWLADRLTEAGPTYLLNGTPLYRVYLRLLGARIGHHVFIGSVTVAAPELLTIGDRAVLGSGVTIANARVEHGELVVGPVRIGADALLDSAGVVEEDTVLGNGATLGPGAALARGGRVPDVATWGGIPAVPMPDTPSPVGPAYPEPAFWRRCWEWLFFPVTGGLVAALFFMPIMPAFMLVDWVDGLWLDTYDSGLHAVLATGVYLLLGLPAAALLVLLTLGMAALVRWLAAPRLVPGSWPLHGLTYYRSWISTQIQENSLHVLHGLFATVYAPLWFRLIGAAVGKHAEISTASGVTPELLELGDDSFIADGVMLGDAQVRGGVVTLHGTRIGARSFVGNGACVVDGTTLPADVLIGVQSLAPANARLAPDQTWMGNPPVLLPAREPGTGFASHLTFRPSRPRWLARATIELLRIVIPMACVLAFGYVAVYTVMPMLELDEWGTSFLALVGVGVGFGLACLVLVLAAKWLLIGRYRPGAAPMWTPAVWLSEAVTAIYESLAVPNLLTFLRGTPLLPGCLRLFGAHIGRGTWLNTTDLTEFDCVEIGDEAELNADCGPQTHLFEDRVMKIGRVRIGARAVIGARATILYDSAIGDDVHLGPATLVAKGEHLPAGTRWHGAPAAPAGP